jgi:hypothetical protein
MSKRELPRFWGKESEGTIYSKGAGTRWLPRRGCYMRQ